LQFAQQIGLPDDQFHGVFSVFRREKSETKNYNKKEVLLKSEFSAVSP